MTFTITQDKAVHKSGTKFYSIYYIKAENEDKAVAIYHYGPYKFGGIVTSPLKNGQSDSMIGAAFDVRRDTVIKRSSKTERGYEDWRTENIKSLNDGDFADWMGENLKQTQIDMINRHFYDDTNPTIKISKPAPSPVVETVIVRPEGWGSW